MQAEPYQHGPRSVKYLAVFVQFTYLPLRTFWESRRTAYYLSVALVTTFGLSLTLALVNEWHLLVLPDLLRRCHFLQAVEISFTPGTNPGRRYRTRSRTYANSARTGLMARSEPE